MLPVFPHTLLASNALDAPGVAKFLRERDTPKFTSYHSHQNREHADQAAADDDCVEPGHSAISRPQPVIDDGSAPASFSAFQTTTEMVS